MPKESAFCPPSLRRGLLWLALVSIWLPPMSAKAQKNSPDIPVVSTATAIENARIVQAPGQVIDSGTVVFRDGVITAVGRRVAIPYDAHIIDAGDTLTVYAGFIDALSHVGIPEPRNQGQPESVPDRSNPPFERAGITPERSARTALDPDDDSVEAMRNAGFTTALVAPRGRMLPGQATLALLAGSDASDMILQGAEPMFFQFQGAQGVYPGTPMGIMSKFRQIYREADRRMQLEAMYADDPSGLSKPPFDRVHEAFFPVVAQDRPVAIWTGDVLEIHRAMKLQEELGFSMMLFGLEGGFDTAEKVAASGAPVALTLELPDKPRWAAKVEADSLQQVLDAYDDETRTATFRDVEAEQSNLESRQLWSRARYVGMAAIYHEAGVPFALASMGADAKDIHDNLREMVNEGLPADAALAALTTNAASMLGVSDRMGTVRAGMMANLVVTHGTLFDEDTTITMTFVNGHAFEAPASEGRRGGTSNSDRANSDR